MIGWQRAGRRASVACTLLLAACQGNVIVDTPPSDLPPPPPFTKNCVSEGRYVFAAASGPGPGPASMPPLGVLRSRLVSINLDVVIAAAAPGDPVRLNLFDDICFDATLERFDRSGPPDYQVWVGSIPGDQFSTVALAFGNGAFYGTVNSPSAAPRANEVSLAGDPVYTIYEFDIRKQPLP